MTKNEILAMVRMQRMGEITYATMIETFSRNDVTPADFIDAVTQSRESFIHQVLVFAVGVLGWIGAAGVIYVVARMIFGEN